MSQVTYDPSIIQEFARRLLKQAASAVLSSVILGLMLGAGLGAGVAADAPESSPSLLVSAIVFGLLGWKLGRDRAFTLRLQAQTALCQMQIELNTRISAHASQRLGQPETSIGQPRAAQPAAPAAVGAAAPYGRVA